MLRPRTGAGVSVDEQDVSDIGGGQVLIGRDVLHQLRDFESQLNRKVLECLGATDLANHGDDLPKRRVATEATMPTHGQRRQTRR
jgi:hypothetical protein